MKLRLARVGAKFKLPLKTVGVALLVFSGVMLSPGHGANLPAGQVVWWGRDCVSRPCYSAHTNGLVENSDEFLTNVVAVAGHQWQGLALKNDGTVFGFGNNMYGGNEVPAGLSNVVSIAVAGNSCWAIRRDGSVARWGNENSDQDPANIVAGLSNVTAIVWGGGENYLALKKDGTVLGMSFANSGAPLIDAATGLPAPNQSPVQLVKVRGVVLSNVVALASMDMTPLVLKSDGTVVSLQYQTPGVPPTEPRYEVHDNVLYEYLGGESAQLPYRYTSANAVMVGGQALSNVIALASGGSHHLALKRDGTVAAWGDETDGATLVPAGLANVAAIAADEHESLALKRNGTVVAWGANYSGQTSVPAGLSNIVAISSAMDFNLAVIAGSVPASVFIRPHGRLEEFAAAADLVFKGRVISTRAITNAAFPDWGNPRATEFKVISVLKGNVRTNRISFLHMTGGPVFWNGSSPPPVFHFEAGQSYLVFAVRADKSDWLYAPSSKEIFKPDEFRQLMKGEIACRTLDARRLAKLPVKEAGWVELNRLLNDSNPSNQLYAIGKLDCLSLAGRGDDEWSRSRDFKRTTVLRALLHVLASRNDQVACRALNCFVTGPDSTANVAPFAGTLIRIANQGPSSNRRLNAIDALSGIDGPMVSNSLSHLLKDPDENVRLGAVRLLPRFPDPFAEDALRDAADDESANVRSVVADVIGGGTYEPCLPVLVKLFHDPAGRDKLIPPTTLDFLQAGQRLNNIGDVHTAAGYALVKFAPGQVAAILQTNLNDPGFHINFVAKLAQGDTEPWLPELVGILEARRAYIDDVAKSPPNDPRKYSGPGGEGALLIGTYTKCWEDIRQYLLKKPPAELASGKYDRYMDELEKMVRPVSGCPGCSVQEARWLYQLYWTKHQTERAAKLRHQYDKTEGWWFDDFNKRGEAAQVGAISF